MTCRVTWQTTRFIRVGTRKKTFQFFVYSTKNLWNSNKTASVYVFTFAQKRLMTGQSMCKPDRTNDKNARCLNYGVLCICHWRHCFHLIHFAGWHTMCHWPLTCYPPRPNGLEGLIWYCCDKPDHMRMWIVLSSLSTFFF